MRIAIPLKKQNDYTELRYALRSIELFIKHSEIIIIGDQIPDWLVNVTQIHVPDIPGQKQMSMRRKILAALEYSKEILLTHDDVFFLKPIKEFTYYYNGVLKSYAESGARPLQKQLEAMGKLTRNYDLHYPLIYDQRFKEASENFTSDVILKSMFCNYFEVEGVQVFDNKLLNQKNQSEVYSFIKDKSSFSTGESTLKIALPVLNELYRNKSKFEV